MSVLAVLVVVAATCAALIGGVFFAFSVFVMRALAGMPPAQGILAMQRINVTVIHPLFLGAFFGAAPLLGAAAALARGDGPVFGVLVAACVVYAAGSIGVTLAFNVPRNNRLAALDPATDEAASYWTVYVREWLAWNHVRCVASLGAAAGSAGALAL